MIGIKEIRNKIKSVDNTKKITKAMEMVSIAKLYKIKKRMNASKPYLNVIKNIISHISSGNLRFNHLFFEERDIKKIGFIIISTDRGLCSNLNVILFKKILKIVQNYVKKNISSNFSILGLKGLTYFQSLKSNIVSNIIFLKENFKLIDLKNIINILLQLYTSKKIDKLFLAYNKFNSIITHTPVIVQLLPILKSSMGDKKDFKWDYIYESNSTLLLDTLFNRYIEFQIYQSVLENITCEHAARMLSMKKAADNSSDLIKKLQISYNKARQSGITQELTEIVSGASAVSLD